MVLRPRGKTITRTHTAWKEFVFDGLVLLTLKILKRILVGLYSYDLCRHASKWAFGDTGVKVLSIKDEPRDLQFTFTDSCWGTKRPYLSTKIGTRLYIGSVVPSIVSPPLSLVRVLQIWLLYWDLVSWEVLVNFSCVTRRLFLRSSFWSRGMVSVDVLQEPNVTRGCLPSEEEVYRKPRI